MVLVHIGQVIRLSLFFGLKPTCPKCKVTMGFSFILSSFFASGRVYLFCAPQRKGNTLPPACCPRTAEGKAPKATGPLHRAHGAFVQPTAGGTDQPSLIDGGNKNARCGNHIAPPGVSPVFAFHTSVDALNQHFRAPPRPSITTQLALLYRSFSHSITMSIHVPLAHLYQ